MAFKLSDNNNILWWHLSSWSLYNFFWTYIYVTKKKTIFLKHKPFEHITFFSNHQIEKKATLETVSFKHQKKNKIDCSVWFKYLCLKRRCGFIINLKVSKTNLVFYRFEDEDILFFYRFSLWPRLWLFLFYSYFLNKHFIIFNRGFKINLYFPHCKKKIYI